MQTLMSSPEFHFSVEGHQVTATFANKDDTMIFNRVKAILMASYTERNPRKQNRKIDKTQKIANTVGDGERHVP